MISAAIQALGFEEGFVLTGNPTNAKEFADSFKLVVGVDEINSAILSDDLSGFPFTWDQIASKLAELQAEYNAQAYARSRKEEYPPLEDQLDHIYHNGIASWKANMVKPVKDKYQKP